jgi:hypothetical protein
VPSTDTAQSSDLWDWSQALSLVLLWDHVSHTAVFYYGAIFAVAGSVGLLFIPGKHRPTVYA